MSSRMSRIGDEFGLTSGAVVVIGIVRRSNPICQWNAE
jgi:hypothetical protein